MSIDLSQFHQIFFEESFEGLDVMESSLVEIQPGTEDLETINTIFRAAHSMKGGAGTFGFNEITDFTHILESLLDEMRNGERDVNKEAIDLLLKSVDILRDILTALQDGNEFNQQTKLDCQQQLQLMLHHGNAVDTEMGEAVSSKTENDTLETVKTDENRGWKIKFVPDPHILLTGNEPSRMFRELAQLGELQTECHLQNLPEFVDFDPESLYLCWTITLESNCTKEEIDEVFEWVIDDCQLTIEPFDSEQKSDSNEAETTESGTELVTETETTRSSKPDKPASKNLIAAKENAPLKKENKSSSSTTPARTIRVDIAKVDELINRVGELVITQSMLSELGENITPESIELFRNGLTELEQNTRELQESVMSVRMMPISFAFNRFPRLVRDVCAQIGKEVELIIIGENTELDKTVMEQISDPLVHIVRNSLDHGIEKPEERLAMGKPAQGQLTLESYHQGGEIIIEVRDDGKGLNREVILDKALEKDLVSPQQELTDQQVYNLIFLPGFSTAEAVSDLSGRGVGMDVVKRNISNLGGSVEIDSALNKGTSLKIRLPLTLAILDGQLIKFGSETFVVPLINMIESLPIDPDAIETFARRGEMYHLRDQYIPMVDLAQLFSIPGDEGELKDKLLLIVEAEGVQVGIIIDELLAQQQVVIKNLDENFKTIEGISGATILGNGSVSLIIDISGVLSRRQKMKTSSRENISREGENV